MTNAPKSAATVLMACAARCAPLLARKLAISAHNDLHLETLELFLAGFGPSKSAGAPAPSAAMALKCCCVRPQSSRGAMYARVQRVKSIAAFGAHLSSSSRGIGIG